MSNTIKSIILMAIACGIGYNYGKSFERDAIEATCKSPDEMTTLNGTQYFCMTKEQAQDLAQQAYNLGRSGHMPQVQPQSHQLEL